MLHVWLLTCFFEIINLWSKGLSVIDISKVLTVFFVLGFLLGIIIFKVGQKIIKKDYTGVKTKLLIGVSMLWIIGSIYLINSHILIILKILKMIMESNWNH